jgi:GNAT superfamily N-acetyltransferase
MQIAIASQSDVEDIASVLLAAFRDFEALYTPDAFRATTPDATRISERLAEGPTWIARLGTVAVATVSAVERPEDVYIRSMAVVPNARGTGVARLLLAEVETFAASRGATRLSLTTTPFLTAAIRVYERAGFRRVPGQLDLCGTPLFAMIKDLQTSRESLA